MIIKLDSDDVEAWEHWWAGNIAQYIPDSSILIVGTGGSELQYISWPETLMSVGAKSVEYLEAWEPYIREFESGPFKIHHGDARNIVGIMGENSYDVVMFLQGIEHLNVGEIAGVAQGIFSVCRKAAVMSCPWGSGYNGQGASRGNPFETHLTKSIYPETLSMLPDWNIITSGTKNGRNGCIWLWKVKSQ